MAHGDKVTRRLERARALRGLGRYDEAAKLVGEALASEPENIDGLALLATLLFRSGRVDEAGDTLRRLLSVHPDDLRGLVLLARVHKFKDEHRLAEPPARRALAISPESITCLTTLAEILHEQSPGSAEALALTDEALRLSPEDASLFLLRGELLYYNGQWRDAEQWILRSLALAPTDEHAILQLALVRGVLGRFDESRDHAASLLRSHPDPATVDRVIQMVEGIGIPADLRELYRMMLTARGRTDLSTPGAAGRDPELVAEQSRLAERMWSQVTDRATRRRAADLARAVLAVDPRDQRARLVLACQAEQEDRPDEAAVLGQALVEEGFGGIHTHVVLIHALAMLRRWDEARAACVRALVDYPASPDLHRDLARSLCELGRADEAMAPARRAAELSPTGVGVQLALGLTAKAAGDLATAERALRDGMRHRPESLVTRAELAQLLVEQDRWDEAEPLAVPLDPAGPVDPDEARLAFHAWAALCGRTTTRFAHLLERAEGSAWDPRLLDETVPWLEHTFDLVALMSLVRPAEEAARVLLVNLGDVIGEITPPPAEDSPLIRTMRAAEQRFAPTAAPAAAG